MNTKKTEIERFVEKYCRGIRLSVFHRFLITIFFVAALLAAQLYFYGTPDSASYFLSISLLVSCLWFLIGSWLEIFRIELSSLLKEVSESPEKLDEFQVEVKKRSSNTKSGVVITYVYAIALGVIAVIFANEYW